MPTSTSCRPGAEQALRAPEQQEDRERVDERGAALGHILLEREVEHADQERRPEHAAHPAETAHRHHDQEVDEVLQGVLGIEPEELGAEPAAQRRHAAAEREGEREQAPDVDPERLGHAPVVDRGPDLRADQRALEPEPEAAGDGGADDDQHDAVGAVLDEAQVDLALQHRGQPERLVLGPDQERDRRDHHEDETDGEEHLVELGRPVEPRIEEALQHRARAGGDGEPDDQGGYEADAPVLHHPRDHVSAEHGEAAVREVDEAHQAHRDRQADRDDEQHHAGGHAAQEDAGDVDAEDHETGRSDCVVEGRPGSAGAPPSDGGVGGRPEPPIYLGLAAQGPIFCSLQASLTPSILPMTFWSTRPSFMTASDRYSFITISRVTGSIDIGPRGLANFQPLSASSAASVSILPLSAWTTWTIAAMPS